MGPYMVICNMIETWRTQRGYNRDDSSWCASQKSRKPDFSPYEISQFCDWNITSEIDGLYDHLLELHTQVVSKNVENYGPGQKKDYQPANWRTSNHGFGQTRGCPSKMLRIVLCGTMMKKWDFGTYWQKFLSQSQETTDKTSETPWHFMSVKSVTSGQCLLIAERQSTMSQSTTSLKPQSRQCPKSFLLWGIWLVKNQPFTFPSGHHRFQC